MIMVCALDGRTWFKLPSLPSPVLNSQSGPLKKKPPIVGSLFVSAASESGHEAHD